MIRYPYVQECSPPAPFAHVSLRCPTTGKAVAQLPAQLDSAADRTAVPQAIVDQLELVPIRKILVGGFGGATFTLSTYLLEVTPRQLKPLMVEVAGSPEESFVLLGRDVLNSFRIVHDGPALTVEFE